MNSSQLSYRCSFWRTRLNEAYSSLQLSASKQNWWLLQHIKSLMHNFLDVNPNFFWLLDFPFIVFAFLKNNIYFSARKLGNYQIFLSHSVTCFKIARSVCSFYTAKLLFQISNCIWKIGLACKVSSLVSHETRWHKK